MCPSSISTIPLIPLFHSNDSFEICAESNNLSSIFISVDFNQYSTLLMSSFSLKSFFFLFGSFILVSLLHFFLIASFQFPALYSPRASVWFSLLLSYISHSSYGHILYFPSLKFPRLKHLEKFFSHHVPKIGIYLMES